jgi:NAD(P)-dependent dehydrogenase (short-subunit alcohol dehydrogenase family)
MTAAQRREDRARTVVVTGGNRGIGYALVANLADRGDQVIFTSRDPDRGTASLEQLKAEHPTAKIRMEVCDLASPTSIRSCAQRLLVEGRPIDGLINNAGVLRPAAQREMTPDGIEVALATNALGPLLLTTALEPALVAAPDARVLILTSRLHLPGSRGDAVDFDFDDPNLDYGYSPDRAYKNSKLAAIWVAKELDRRLPDPATCDAICPGFVPSTAAQYTSGWQRFLLRRILPHFRFTTSVEQAAEDVLWALDVPELAGAGGRYLSDRRVAEPSADASDEGKANRFWVLAAELASMT